MSIPSNGSFNRNTRLATSADAPAIARVHYESIRFTFARTIPEYANSRTLEEFEKHWDEVLAASLASYKSNRTITYVLEREEKIVGFVSAAQCNDDDVDRTIGLVARIYLLPQHIGDGNGAVLLSLCEEQLCYSGFNAATLWVFEVNARARRFYERHGYQPDGKRKVAFNAPMLRYRKKLNSQFQLDWT